MWLRHDGFSTSLDEQALPHFIRVLSKAVIYSIRRTASAMHLLRGLGLVTVSLKRAVEQWESSYWACRRFPVQSSAFSVKGPQVAGGVRVP